VTLFVLVIYDWSQFLQDGSDLPDLDEEPTKRPYNRKWNTMILVAHCIGVLYSSLAYNFAGKYIENTKQKKITKNKLINK